MKKSIKDIKWKPTQRQFVIGFFAVVVLLAMAKRVTSLTILTPKGISEQSSLDHSPLTIDQSEVDGAANNGECSMVNGQLNKRPHRILSVPNYKAAFPDSQSVQIVMAERWGVKPVRNREDAEARKKELVYIGESPYFHVDPLYSSIPYLVPRAAVLLQDIGAAFYDSLYVKGVPLNQLIVTSVLRSMDDVAKLQRRNGNATENSCHLYGTTFDICYNRYHPVGREVRNDTLKWVLSEVLRDKRDEGRCYVKYEVKQGCFHMTVR